MKNYYPVKKWSTQERQVVSTKEREAVGVPLPFSMHTGQIIMLTKLLAKKDLTFYDFSTGKPVYTWKSTD